MSEEIGVRVIKERGTLPSNAVIANGTSIMPNEVAGQLNNRPRKSLRYKTPLQIIEMSVALTS